MIQIDFLVPLQRKDIRRLEKGIFVTFKDTRRADAALHACGHRAHELPHVDRYHVRPRTARRAGYRGACPVCARGVRVLFPLGLKSFVARW